MSTDDTAFDLIIRGARVVTQGGTRELAVAIRDGVIAALLEPGVASGARAARVIEASGLIVLPGLFDMHVHFREPGPTHKEDFASGSAAATVGGFTSVGDMPNTVPPTTTADRLRDKRALGEGRSRVDFAIWGGAGNSHHIAELAAAGAVGVKVFLGLETAPGAHSDAPSELVVVDDAAFLDILQAAAAADILVAVHCGNAALRSRGREGWSGKGWAELRNLVASESQLHKVEAVSRTLLLAAAVGARVHIVHVPAPALPLIARAKDAGQPVTAEASLPFMTHDLLDEAREMGFDRYRSAVDAERLWAAIRDGTVDALATDHAPHTEQEKALGRKDLLAAPSGYPELDTALPMLLDAVNRGVISLERLVEVYAEAPARILGVGGKGQIAVGKDADLVLVDLQREATIERERLQTKGGWSPFEGRQLTGWPVRTLLRGEDAAIEGKPVGSPRGRFLSPD